MIEEIEDRYKTLSERAYKMLQIWKQSNGTAADYKTLHDALVHDSVKKKILAEDFCFE